jgi:hypothetical protein
MTPPFDIDSPPREPPNHCVYPERWRWHYSAYQRHLPGRYQRCVCGDSWPCPVQKFAVRGLLDACTGTKAAVGVVAAGTTEGALFVLDMGTCRWCRESIELRRVWGWVHREREAGLYLCRRPSEGAPPYCGVEPWFRT